MSDVGIDLNNLEIYNPPSKGQSPTVDTIWMTLDAELWFSRWTTEPELRKQYAVWEKVFSKLMKERDLDGLFIGRRIEFLV